MNAFACACFTTGAVTLYYAAPAAFDTVRFVLWSLS